MNYAPVSGTLTFPPGVTSESFMVPLLNTGLTNPPLTVHFTLTNATGGATLAVRPHSVLSILHSEPSPGTNINGYLLAKVEFYSQTNTTAPSQADRSVTSRFFASVHPKFPGGVFSGSLWLANGTARSLGGLLANYQCFLEYNEDFPSSASMNKAFPPGKYVLNFESLTDGSYFAPISLGVERTFVAPHLTNWVEAQTIDPAATFTLKWAPFAGAGSSDIVRVMVTDDSGEYVVYTPDEFDTGALPGSTTTLTIPAGILDYGKRYLAEVVFSKIVGLQPRPYPELRSGFASARTTGVYVHTIAAPQ